MIFQSETEGEVPRWTCYVGEGNSAARLLPFLPKGFTLIELLVVIAIIAILAALLLSGLATAKQQGQSAKCASNLREMGIALKMYVDDFGHYPLFNEDSQQWNIALELYLKCSWTNTGIHCPSYTGPISDGSLGPSSYGYNVFGGGVGPPELGLGEGNGGIRENDVLVPSDMFAIADSQQFLWTDPPYGYNGMVGAGHLECVLDSPSTRPRRHGSDYNVVCCDTHVLRLNPLKLFDPTNTASEWNRDHQPHPELWNTTWQGSLP